MQPKTLENQLFTGAGHSFYRLSLFVGFCKKTMVIFLNSLRLFLKKRSRVFLYNESKREGAMTSSAVFSTILIPPGTNTLSAKAVNTQARSFPVICTPTPFYRRYRRGKRLTVRNGWLFSPTTTAASVRDTADSRWRREQPGLPPTSRLMKHIMLQAITVFRKTD